MTQEEKEFIAVYPDLQYSLHSTSTDALSQEESIFVAQRRVKEIFTTFHQSRKKYCFTIVNRNNEKYTLHSGSWSVTTSSIEHFFYYTNRLEFKMTDPLGEERLQTLPSPISVEAIVDLYKYLIGFADFTCWNHYELSVENENLKKQLLNLENMLKHYDANR